MARKYYKRKPKKKKNKIEERLNWELDPETRRSIVGVCLIVAGLVFGLGVLGWGGTLGDIIGSFLTLLFGLVAYPIPIVLVVIGVIILSPTAIEFRASTYLGVVLALVSLASILHIFALGDKGFELAKNGDYGGIIGFGVAYAFKYIFDFWASLIILIGSFIVSSLVATNFSLRGAIQKIQIAWEERMEERRKKSPPKIKKGQKSRFSLFGKKSQKKEEKEEKKTTEEVTPVSKDDSWNFPPLKLLEDNDTNPKAGNIKKNSRIIEETLDNFGIDVDVKEVNVGPTVSQYALKPDTGVKLNQITARQNDLSLALAAHPIRIEAPIPGRSAVGIEVPNKVPAIVKLRKIIASSEYKKEKDNLSIVMGRNVSGEPVFGNLKEMPHLLIAGATGSGKSVSINSIITTFLYNNSPRDLRLILVDPKRVEFTQYNDVPHLLTPVITDTQKAVSALKWSISEMERRYEVFQDEGKRNLETYNQAVDEEEQMPMIVIFIDELADLMATAARDIEAAIVRLTQMARATGIHLVVATQRPSVDVITGLIKANITNRIAFAVASQVDSRTILDQAGAEKLLGNGDMLYLGKDAAKPRRIQGVFLEDSEIKKVTEFLKDQAEAKYNEDITEFEGKIDKNQGIVQESDEEDELLEEAAEIVVKNDKGSASLLQRRLSIGYARAARILDELQARNIVGPSQDSKPREVRVQDTEQLAQLLEAQNEQEGPNDS